MTILGERLATLDLYMSGHFDRNIFKERTMHDSDPKEIADAARKGFYGDRKVPNFTVNEFARVKQDAQGVPTNLKGLVGVVTGVYSSVGEIHLIINGHGEFKFPPSALEKVVKNPEWKSALEKVVAVNEWKVVT